MEHRDIHTKHEFTELTKQTNLCLDHGYLNPEAIGWSRKPIIFSNLSRNYFRKKLWNYWCITGPDAMFSVTISDVDYAKMVFAYYLDYSTGEFVEGTEIAPFWKNIQLPDHPRKSCTYISENVSIEMKVPDTGEETRIFVDWKNFQGQHLEAEFIIETSPKHESLNVVVPWSKNRFQYTSKQVCLPVKGWFQRTKKSSSDGFEDKLKKEFTEFSYATLDFGRGVWPYKCSWNWGSFSTRIGVHCLGLNIGGKWTDGTGISENGIVLDGKLYKIQEPVEWNYDRSDFRKEWKMKTTRSSLLDLRFEPFFERKAITNLVLIYSEVHQCFGRYSGIIQVQNQTYSIESAIGWAEEHIARW